MTIAAKHFDPQLGIDIHLTLIPPSPIPVPLPTPHIGLVLDPFDYLPFIGNEVHVNGVKSATAGTGGLDVHIPLGAWMPPMKLPTGPQMEDELFMGSMTVLNSGEPFSRIGMPVLDCNFIGMIPPFRMRKPKKPKLSMMLPTAVNIAIPTNVFIGGTPMISLQAMAFKAAFKLIGKAARRAAPAFKKMRQKVFGHMKPGFLKCKVLRAEPVDIRDGSVSVTHEDFHIPGRLPLAWSRSYSSTDTHAGLCGHGWHTPADIRLSFEPDGAVLFFDVDSVAVFPHLPTAAGSDHAVREFVDGARLRRDGDELIVRSKAGPEYAFRVPATTPWPATLPIERIGDLCGNHWSFQREHGHLVRIVESGCIDPDTGQPWQGRFLEVDERRGRIEQIQLHDPATGLNHPLVRYRFDAEGDLIAAADALGAERTFEYRQHRMLRHTDRVGLSFHYAYNAKWQVVHAWGDGGLHEYRFAYDSLLNETAITDSRGHTSIVKFDANRLPLCEIDALDGITSFVYDDVGRTVAITDPAGARTQFDYDERGNLLKLTRPDGSVLETAYDADDRPIAVTDPDKAVWRQQWDARGLLVEQVTPLNAVSRFDYDHAGQLQSHTDPLGAVTRLQFDRHGQLRQLTDPLGANSLFKHDGLGRLQSQTNPAGQVTRYHVDAKRRVLQIEQPGGIVQCDYDAEDQLLRYTDEAGNVTRLDYVGIGQIARRVQADGHVVRYEYDTEEQLVAVINQRGERYELRRDALGRIIEEVDYWGQSREYRYDPAGRLTGTADPLGRVIAYATDLLGRITGKTLPEGFKETFKYDERGQLVELRNPHRRITRAFDAEGRLTEEVQDGFRIANSFDLCGQRVLRETSAGNRIACEFDARGQVSRVTLNDEAPIEIGRDALGRTTTERLSPQVQRELHYDERGLLTAQRVLRDEAPLFDTGYDYDRSGNLTARRDSAQGSDAYTYDPIGRLLSHLDPRGKLNHFLNDPAGDRLRTRVQQTQARQVVGGAPEPEHWTREGDYEGQRYVFDRAGNLVRRGDSRSFDRPGDEAKDLQLQWDANQRLIESINAGQRTQYGYDPLGRRVFKRNPTHTTWFFWDGDALLGEVTHPNHAANAPDLRDDSAPLDFLSRRKRQRAFEPLHPEVREYVYYPGTFVPLALIDRQAIEEAANEAGNAAQATEATEATESNVALAQSAVTPSADSIRAAPAHNIEQSPNNATPEPLASAPPKAAVHSLPPSGGGLGRGGALGTVAMSTGRLETTTLSREITAPPYEAAAPSAVASDTAVPTEAIPQAATTPSTASHNSLPPGGGGLGRGGALGSDANGLGGRGGTALGNSETRSVRMATQPVAIQSPAPNNEQTKSPLDPAAATAPTHSSQTAISPAPQASLIAEDSAPTAATASVIPFPPATKEPTRYVTQIYHYHVDPNGCPTRLTDTAGTIVWSASYAAWGEITQQHIAQIENPLRFQGQYFDAESGLLYTRHRYYDPSTGQFAAIDPIGLQGGVNLFAYAPNPFSWCDPLGLAKRNPYDVSYGNVAGTDWASGPGPHVNVVGPGMTGRGNRGHVGFIPYWVDVVDGNGKVIGKVGMLNTHLGSGVDGGKVKVSQLNAAIEAYFDGSQARLSSIVKQAELMLNETGMKNPKLRTQIQQIKEIAEAHIKAGTNPFKGCST